jgi:hypothetical protein
MPLRQQDATPAASTAWGVPERNPEAGNAPEPVGEFLAGLLSVPVAKAARA